MSRPSTSVLVKTSWEILLVVFGRNLLALLLFVFSTKMCYAKKKKKFSWLKASWHKSLPMTGLFLIKLVYFKLIMSAFSKSYFSVSLESLLKKTLHFNGEILRPVTGYKAVWLTFQPWSRHPLSTSPLGSRPGFPSSVVFSSVKWATVIPDSPVRNLGVHLLNTFLFLPVSQSAARSCEFYRLNSRPFIPPASLCLPPSWRITCSISVLVPLSLASVSPYAYRYLNHHFRMKCDAFTLVRILKYHPSSYK